MTLLNLGDYVVLTDFSLIPYYFYSFICQEIAQIPLGVLLKLEIRNKKLKKDRVVLASDYIDTFPACSAVVCLETQCSTLLDNDNNK